MIIRLAILQFDILSIKDRSWILHEIGYLPLDDSRHQGRSRPRGRFGVAKELKSIRLPGFSGMSFTISLIEARISFFGMQDILMNVGIRQRRACPVSMADLFLRWILSREYGIAMAEIARQSGV